MATPASVFTERAQQLQDQRWKDQRDVQLTPLQESLRADHQRLTQLVDDKGNPLPDKQADYDFVHNRMANTIGQMRSLYGQKPGGANPVEAALGNVADKLHITNHLKNHVAQARADAEAKYQGQNQTMAGEYAAGTPPPNPADLTPAEAHAAARVKGGLDPGAEKTPDMKPYKLPSGQVMYLDAKNPSALPAGAVPVLPGDDKAPKGMKAMEQGGVAFGVQDQDTGKQYLPSQLSPNGDAPPEAKQIWSTIQAAQKAKSDEQAKHDADRDKRLANTLGNMGTWTIAEDGKGNTTLYNSKTGQTKEAPTGLHKSGYYAKQIAPLEAANLNISDYMQNGVFDGPGDLALQHEFFTATQPSTGFRMTKVQQDILQNSRSWLQGAEAKALHAKTGVWYTPEQRQQIARAAQEAIENKKKALSGYAGGPKTEQLRQTQKAGSGPSDDDIIKALSGAK